MKKYLLTTALLAVLFVLVSCECKEHTFTQWESAITATCTETGTETRGCENCKYTKERTTEALGHSFGEAVLVNGISCTQPYEMASTCSVCGTVQTETVQPSGHVYDKENEELKHILMNPSCIYEGIVRYQCTVCRSPYDEDMLEERTPTIDHKWASKGCERPFYCSMCNTKGAPAPGHDWAKYDYKCSKCGLIRGMGQG